MQSHRQRRVNRIPRPLHFRRQTGSRHWVSPAAARQHAADFVKHVLPPKSLGKLFTSLNHESVLTESCPLEFALLTTSWRGAKGGGVLTYALSIVEKLKSMGARTDVYARYGERGVGDDALFVTQSKGAMFVLRSLREMLKHDYQGMLCNDAWYTLPPCLAYSLIRRANIVYIAHTFVDQKELRDRAGLRGVMFKALFFLHRIGIVKIVFVSEHLRRHFATILRFEEAGRAAVIRASAPPEASVSRSPDSVRQFRTRFGIEDTDRLVLGQGLTALMIKARGAAVLIEALPKVRDRHPNVKLMLTRGDRVYSQVPWLEEVARNYGVTDQVVFTGELDDPMLAVNACDIFAHIVLNEGGLPLALLEAMAAGKPIVAARRGGILEAVAHEVNGLLVEPDRDEVAAAIIRLIEAPDLASQLAQRAKDSAAGMSWENAAASFLELLSAAS